MCPFLALHGGKVHLAIVGAACTVNWAVQEPDFLAPVWLQVVHRGLEGVRSGWASIPCWADHNVNYTGCSNVTDAEGCPWDAAHPGTAEIATACHELRRPPAQERARRNACRLIRPPPSSPEFRHSSTCTSTMMAPPQPARVWISICRPLPSAECITRGRRSQRIGSGPSRWLLSGRAGGTRHLRRGAVRAGAPPVMAIALICSSSFGDLSVSNQAADDRIAATRACVEALPALRCRRWALVASLMRARCSSGVGDHVRVRRTRRGKLGRRWQQLMCGRPRDSAGR
jgi:hypothetical protein